VTTARARPAPRRVPQPEGSLFWFRPLLLSKLSLAPIRADCDHGQHERNANDQGHQAVVPVLAQHRCQENAAQKQHREDVGRNATQPRRKRVLRAADRYRRAGRVRSRAPRARDRPEPAARPRLRGTFITSRWPTGARKRGSRDSLGSHHERDDQPVPPGRAFCYRARPRAAQPLATGTRDETRKRS
jgi:hypothetical protein